MDWATIFEFRQKLDLGTFITCSCIGLLGIIANITAFRGFQKQTKKTSTSFLFQSLAVADVCVLITVCPEILLQYFSYESWFRNYNYKFFIFLTIWTGLAETAILSTNGITVLLTVTRFIAVCFPLHTSRLCSTKRVKLYLAATISISIGFNLPFMLIYLLFDLDLLNTQTLYAVVGYLDIFKPIMFCIIPLLIITVLTIILIVKLKILNQHRQAIRCTNRPRSNATQVLIVVNIVFVVCTLPWPLLGILRRFGLNYLNYISIIVQDSIAFCHTVNSSVNFLIYTLLSKQYRDVVIQNCRCLHSRQENISMTANIKTAGMIRAKREKTGKSAGVQGAL